MVIVPERFIFLETPRTASRSVAVTLVESCRFAKRSGCRHILPQDVPRLGLPIWTFTRDPIEHLYSWWKYGIEGKAMWVFTDDRSKITTFEEFAVKPFSPLQGFEHDCLNVYHAVADNFWPLEWGLSGFFDLLGIVPKNKHIIGATKDSGTEHEVDERLMTARFKRDFRIYRSATVK